MVASIFLKNWKLRILPRLWHLQRIMGWFEESVGGQMHPKWIFFRYIHRCHIVSKTNAYMCFQKNMYFCKVINGKNNDNSTTDIGFAARNELHRDG